MAAVGSSGGIHREVRIGDSMIMIGEGSAEAVSFRTSAELHIYVDDADVVFRRALAAGATSLGEPADRPYGERSGFVRDPFGNYWFIATHLGASYMPHGLRTVTPFVHAKSTSAYIEFLKRAFGAIEEARHDVGGGSIVYARMRIGMPPSSWVMLPSQWTARFTYTSVMPIASTTRRWPQVRDRFGRRRLSPTATVSPLWRIQPATSGSSHDRGRGMRVIEAFWRDVRFAWRSLQRSPGFTMCACLVLSIAVGATTALFTLLDRNILRALPYPDPDRLVVIHETLPVSITPQNAVNAAHFEEWRAAHSFERIALILPVSITLSGPTEPELVGGARVSASLFGMLGASVVHGRTFLEHEDELGRDRVAVLGYDLWTRRYGADSAIVGQHVRLDGEPYTVVGVLGPRFEPPSLARLYPFTVTTDRPEIWTPLGLRPSERVPTQGFMFACIARLKPQVSVAQARAEIAAVQGEIGRGLPGSIDLGANVVTLHEQLTAVSRTPLQLLFATAIAVLLVACVNIANLLVVRGVARQREFAIMQAVGAAPRRVLRQVLAETVTLAGTSGVLGAGLASILLRWIFLSAPIDLPRIEGTEVDGRVLIFVVMTSGATALVLGLVPAWRSSIVAPTDALRSGTSGGGRGWETRVRSLLLGLEVGASATCLLVAGLLVASLMNVLNVDSGFAKDRVVSGELRLPATRYRT